ncbi:hypothetical protein AB6Q56_15130 [Dechloromonas sp. ARDL1]
MTPSIPAPSSQPVAPARDEPERSAGPASGGRNPAQTDDSPVAILGYN